MRQLWAASHMMPMAACLCAALSLGACPAG